MTLSILAKSDGKPSVFTLRKRVTDTLIQLQDNVEYIFRFDEAMQQSEPRKARLPNSGEPSKEAKKPATICRVTELGEDGNELQKGMIVVPYQLEEDLKANYPDNGYVGKIFMMAKVLVKIPGGNNFNKFQIAEVALSDEQPEAEREEASKPAKKK